jgi:acyl carrier protein
MSIRSTVIAELENVAEEQGRQVGPLTDQMMLMETGLDSLCLAVLVVRLQDRLGIDPFATPDGVGFPVTLGDFVEMYEKAKP